MALGTMWKNRLLAEALIAEADPVAFAKANMDALRAAYFVNRAIVSQTAKTCARMLYYGAVDAGTLDKAKGGILKAHGQQHPDAKGIMGNVFNDEVWTFSRAYKFAAVVGFAGDIELGTAVDLIVEPYDADGNIAAGNAAPHVFAARVSAQQACREYADVINGINNLEVAVVGNVMYIIPIRAWRAIKVRSMVVTPV